MQMEKSTEKQVRLSAPTYMRPKQTVLDAPLDIDAGKRVVSPPVNHETRKEFDDLAAPEPQAGPKDVLAEVQVKAAETVTAVEELVVEEVVSGAVQETQAAVIEDAQEPVTTAEEEVETENQTRRKGMSVFQQFIVLLLLLVVALFLATIYLYTNGWIELPEVVLNLVDKGLSLLQ